MQKRKLLLGLVCLTANTTWLLETAHADRRTGLGGNLLIQDPDDVFPFPQYAVKHRNMIRLDYGRDFNSGNGVLTLGNEKHAFGIALHRGDLLSPDIVGFNTELAWLAGVQNPFGNIGNGALFLGPTNAFSEEGPVAPATVFDVMYGRQVGDNAIGLRLGFGRGIQASNVDGEVAKGQQTFVAAQVGYSWLPQQGFKLDLSGNVVAAFASSTTLVDGDEEDAAKGNRIRAGFLGRGYYPLNNVVDIGFIGHASFDNQHIKDEAQDITGNLFNVGLMGGVGPAIHLERAKVAAYGGVEGNISKSDPNTDNDDDASKGLNFLVPMVNMAAEVQVLDWLYLRTGTQYSWNIERQKTTPPGGDIKDRTSNGNFIWTAGLGVAKNSFSFDGVVQNGFVTNGPSFIGGGGNGFLAMASMTYKFGDVFSGESMQPAVEPVQQSAIQEEPVAPAPTPPQNQEYAPPPPPVVPLEGSLDGTTTAPSGGVNVGGSVSTP
jgi:hypothetical protein